MRTYIAVTGIVFGLLVVTHVARVMAEGLQVLRDPFFALSTLIAAGFCVWAWRLLLNSRAKNGAPKRTA